jgi:hypothetical protein
MKMSRIITMNWLERMIEGFGGGQKGARRAAGASKHGRAKSPQRNWRTAKRKEHKRQKLARRAQRGKR